MIFDLDVMPGARDFTFFDLERGHEITGAVYFDTDRCIYARWNHVEHPQGCSSEGKSSEWAWQLEIHRARIGAFGKDSIHADLGIAYQKVVADEAYISSVRSQFKHPLAIDLMADSRRDGEFGEAS